MTENGRSFSLKVAKADQKDSGRGIVRISDDFMHKNQFKVGDVVQIPSKFPDGINLGTCVELGRHEDREQELIRMDFIQRAQVGVLPGEIIQVIPVEKKKAKSITIAPFQEDLLDLLVKSRTLKQSLLHRPLTTGEELVIIGHIRHSSTVTGSLKMHRSDTHLRYGFVRLVVISTNPIGIVIIGHQTRIRILPFAHSRFVTKPSKIPLLRSLFTEYGDIGILRRHVYRLQHGDGNTRWRAAEALGEIGDEQVIEPLTLALEDKNPIVRKMAEQALEKINRKLLRGH